MDAVAELINRKSAVGKTAICDLNTGSISHMSRCIGTEFRIRQQHPKRGNSRLELPTLVDMRAGSTQALVVWVVDSHSAID